jgi:hypothetical protein
MMRLKTDSDPSILDGILNQSNLSGRIAARLAKELADLFNSIIPHE